jgi:hypothetical protein
MATTRGRTFTVPVGQIASRVVENREAFEDQAVGLLRKGSWTPVILAVLSEVFPPGVSGVPVERVHSRALALFDELSETPDSTLPMLPTEPQMVRTLIGGWVHDNWLNRAPTDEGDMYTMTRPAMSARKFLNDLASEARSDRPAVTDSQVERVMELTADLARATTIDPQELQAALVEQANGLRDKLAQVEADLDRIDQGDLLVRPDAGEVLTRYTALQRVIAQMPLDLNHVEDSFVRMAAVLRTDFIGEGRPHGAIIGDYLSRVEALRDTPQGRGFDQAKRVVHTSARIDQLRQNLDTILRHEFTDALTDREKDELRTLPSTLAAGVNGVVDRRGATTRALSSFLRAYDPVAERQIAEALKRCQVSVKLWSEAHPNRRARVGIPVGFHETWCRDGQLGTPDIPSMRERMDQEVSTGVDPVSTPTPDGAPGRTMEELRSLGGPHHAELVVAVAEALAHDGGLVYGTDVFAVLDDADRRPTDLIGLLAMAVRDGQASPSAVRYRTRRPDGTDAIYEAPDLLFWVDAWARAEGTPTDD